jgi:hypothetical protein
MGRTFNIRYKEHIQAIRNNNSNSGYSNHIPNTGHTYGTITDTYYGHCKHREKRKTPKHIREISYL